jgi:hypothetical protein
MLRQYSLLIQSDSQFLDELRIVVKHVVAEAKRDEARRQVAKEQEAAVPPPSEVAAATLSWGHRKNESHEVRLQQEGVGRWSEFSEFRY